MYKTPHFALLMTALAFAVPAWSQDEPPTDEPPVVESLQVTVRELRVHVFDKNEQHVSGLKPGDFLIEENGNPVEIRFFEEVDSSVPAAQPVRGEPMSGAPNGTTAEDPDQRRTLVVLIDSANMTHEYFDSVLASAQHFLENDLQPGDLVKLVHLDREPVQLTPFTTERSRLLEGLSRIDYQGALRDRLTTTDREIGRGLVDLMDELNESTGAGVDPITLDDLINIVRSGGRIAAARLNNGLGIDANSGGETDFSRERQMARLKIAESQLEHINGLVLSKEQVKLQFFLNLQQCLIDLGGILTYMPGQKSIFYFNGGSFIEQNGAFQDSVPLIEEVGRVLNSAATTIYAFHARQKIDVATTAASSSSYIFDLGILEHESAMQSFTEQVTDTAKAGIRSNTVVENSIQAASGSLAAARETGGIFLEGANPEEIAGAFDRINQASRRFYRIAFPTDGGTRRAAVKVELAAAQKGWKLLYGKEFQAQKPFAKQNPRELAIACETALLYGRKMDNEIAAEAGYFLLTDSEQKLLVPMFLRLDEIPPANNQGYQLGLAVIDGDRNWADRTITQLPSLALKSDLVFYDLLLPDKPPRNLHFYIRDLDTGRQSLYAVPLPPRPPAGGPILLLGDPAPKNMIPINHMRKKVEATAGEEPLSMQRKSQDPFWFGDYLFVPRRRPALEGDGVVDVFFTVALGDYDQSRTRFFVENDANREGLSGRVQKQHFDLRGFQTLLAQVQLPILQPGNYRLVVEIAKEEGEPIVLKEPFSVRGSGDALTPDKLNARLFDLAARGGLAEIKPLLALGADINATDALGDTVLMVATQKNNTGLINGLLDVNADVTLANNRGVLPLMVAASWGEEAICRRMIAQGADVNEADFTGNTALIYAAVEDHLSVVKLLLAQEAEADWTNEKEETALSLAAHANSHRVIPALIAAGAEVDQVDLTERTPLMRAVLNGSHKAMKELLKAGAKVDFQGATKITALMYAAIAKDDDACRMLLNKGANINITEINGNTPIALAADLGLTDITRKLAQWGGDVNTHNVLDETPLMLAAIRNFTGTAEVLIQQGAKIDAANKGVTSLMLAALNGHLEMVQLLLKAGADPSLHDNTGQTALGYAEKAGHEDVVKLLERRVN